MITLELVNEMIAFIKRQPWDISNELMTKIAKAIADTQKAQKAKENEPKAKEKPAVKKVDIKKESADKPS